MQVKISNVLFASKQNIPWNDVETYLKRYIGEEFIVSESGDHICIGRIKGDKLFLYDIIDIKKEASTPR